jgi:DNA-binding XRE family transcriptional regulator
MARTINKGAAKSATVMLSRTEYERLLTKAGEPIPQTGPALPKPDSQGNFPAVEFLRASIARELVRRRTSAGLSQSALGELADVNQETISRIETARVSPSERVMQRIEAALRRQEAAIARQSVGKRKARQKPAA